MFSFLLQRMYSDRGGTDKNHLGQKAPGQTPLDKNLRELRQTSL